ncbi:Hsp33 family molecular chaperone HslO [Papillibacter cinnamivorans]|uniref:33 kDa chaperonin n=1 Tax=Papillibacter cinnamivorans DSM 12816 TaxID=1122930 RepID=A0A1W2CKW2_9FIRM|nr:Hsp33 family molecular chaperone HslO [Papillibacter cinnamivorans]SMC85656.1 molecular chaperone Hsp33 [Papillibacter cinnamivorans DSM 12816]
MADKIVKAIAGDGYVKAIAITSTELTERARKIHNTTPLATAALGRALAAVSMLGSMLKEEAGSVTLRINGGGPLGTILTVSDSGGNVRGYLQNPDAELPLKRNGKLDVGGGVGTDGSVTISRDLGLKEPYVGSVPLVSGEIAEDVAAYFAESEQTPTVCALGVLVDVDHHVLAAGGYLIQLLPGAEEDLIDTIEQAVREAGPVTSILTNGGSAETLLERALAGLNPEILESFPMEYRCYCTRDRVTRALISMGRQELYDLAEEQGGAELTCQFCDRVYDYTKEEILGLADSARLKSRRNEAP